MIQEWLNLVLDAVVTVMASILTTLAVRLHSSSAFAGASLFTLVSFGVNLSDIVVFYTMLETSLGAVARLNTFNKTVKPEDRDDEDIVPPEQWPRSGRLELKCVSATYHSTADDQIDNDSNSSGTTPNLALRNIHLTIRSGEKVAICGRTGSGKSSLIALLLKLLDPVPETPEDAVMIDDTPLRRINRAALRERLIAVPQEAVFLPDGCSVQANLDPSGVSEPEECQAVLVAVGMWSFVQDRGGLAAGMSPATLSAGQGQLLSLGRALLKRRIRLRSLGQREEDADSGILLLDEVSSSVDRETERVMQQVIRDEFGKYTVLAVSHRLDMIMDFDTVVVMDRGAIVEVGNPAALAARAGTKFGDLVRAAQS
jgi:ABC-type multidrug transport system fused ATPase/permease subunit